MAFYQHSAALKHELSCYQSKKELGAILLTSLQPLGEIRHCVTRSRSAPPPIRRVRSRSAPPGAVKRYGSGFGSVTDSICTKFRVGGQKSKPLPINSQISTFKIWFTAIVAQARVDVKSSKPFLRGSADYLKAERLRKFLNSQSKLCDDPSVDLPVALARGSAVYYYDM